MYMRIVEIGIKHPSFRETYQKLRIYLKIKIEIYKLIKILVELNVDVRILIP